MNCRHGDFQSFDTLLYFKGLHVVRTKYLGASHFSTPFSTPLHTPPKPDSGLFLLHRFGITFGHFCRGLCRQRGVKYPSACQALPRDCFVTLDVVRPTVGATSVSRHVNLHCYMSRASIAALLALSSATHSVRRLEILPSIIGPSVSVAATSAVCRADILGAYSASTSAS